MFDTNDQIIKYVEQKTADFCEELACQLDDPNSEKFEITLAKQLFEKAANYNKKISLYKLGSMHYHGFHNEIDNEKAFKYFKLATEQECEMSANNLGVMYSQGIHIEKDIDKSIEYFKIAANKEYAESQYNLAMLYLTENNKHSNPNEGFNLLLKAANQGLINAEFNLGAIYFEGEIVEKSLPKAFIWYGAAASKGDEEAIEACKYISSIVTKEENEEIMQLLNS